jgi:hypothetical protein
MADRDYEFEEINKRLQSLELRLSRLESGMITAENEKSFPEEPHVNSGSTLLESANLAQDEETGLESQIGRFGLAWMGSIVLFFGITFLTQYLMNIGHHVSSCILGYLAAASIFILANYLKKTNSHLAFMFKMNAQVLLFYITLRLHFFSLFPLIPNKAIALILLLVIISFQSYLSIRNKSQVLAVLALVFSLTTAVAGDSTHFMLPLISLTSAGVVYLFVRFNWKPLLVIAIFLTYAGFLLWLFGNPVMGHPLQLISEQHSGIIYLFGLGACFSILLLFRNKDSSGDDFLTGVIFINGLLFTFLLLLVVLRFFYADYVSLFSVITICCLIFSTILHSKSDWNFASAFYALYGFMAMSIALYGLVGLPEVYLLLSVQSLIVVTMALWFRNRLIVVMNSLLFLTILFVFLTTSDSVTGVNFSFALVALISARIINWKKSRLKIETDLMRNLYMLEGFVMMLYALNHALPKQFVTLSWTLAGLLYFLISILLKNVKYRYMALGNMICAAFYLFLVDLARIELIFRVLALLFLAAISIGISIYYSNRIKKSDQ